MKNPRKKSAFHEALTRAAVVRQRWSPKEKLRRQGLPPDTPWTLLRHLLAPASTGMSTGFDRPTGQWYQVAVEVQR